MVSLSGSPSASSHLAPSDIGHHGTVIADADAEFAQRPPASVPVPKVTSGWDPRVLVVDDDEVSRIVAVELLRELGLTADVASDGRQALEMGARWAYVAILMDCEMPEVDGYTAARRLSRLEGRNFHTPVIAMTSRPRMVSLASGMDYHLAKPLGMDVLRVACVELGMLARDGTSPSEPTEVLGTGTPLLDASIFGRIAGGDGAERAQRATMLIEQMIARLPEFWRAANADDGLTLRRLALPLKESAALVGAGRVAELCDRLSKIATGKSVESGSAIELLLRHALEDTLVAIAAYVGYGNLADAPEAQAGASDDAEPIHNLSDLGPPAPLRVALADDDPLARVAITAMLESAEWLALVGDASDVDEIVELAAVKQPDIVLLDCMMPGGGGREAARRILDQRPDTLIVALTSSDTVEALTDMMSAGASCLVAKGGSAQQLTETIRRALKSVAPARANDEKERFARRHIRGGRRSISTSPSRGPLDPAGVERLRVELGSTGILAELVQLFSRQSREIVDDMRTAIFAGNARDVTAKAHQLKGACSTLAAIPMAQLCDDLETAARGGALAGARALVDQIEAASLEAHAALLAEVA